MTLFERLDHIRTAIYTPNYYNQYIGGDIEFNADCDEIEKALKKVDKYKRHDLRKNPNDLPSESGKYLCCFKYNKAVDEECVYDILWFGRVDEWEYPEFKGKRVFHMCDHEYGDIPIDDVIAWKYIQEFEEE